MFAGTNYRHEPIRAHISKGVEDMTDAVVVQCCRRLIPIDAIVWIIHCVLACKIGDACFQRRLRRPS